MLEAEKKIYEVNQIIAYMFEGDGDSTEGTSCNIPVDSDNTDDGCDPVTGIYPGQLPNMDETLADLKEETVECKE